MGFKIEQWSRRECIGLAASALLLFTVYLKTASPAFPANDSPETISAAWELGIQHPPGYPLHTLLGRISMLALPGSPAWRMNCLSASLGVSCALVLALLVRMLRVPGGFAVPLAAFFALGFWRMAWEQATEAKGGIYLLNLLLCLVLLAAFFEFLRRDSRKALGIFWLASGLALANHYMSAALFILPCAAWIFWKRRHFWIHTLWVLPGLSLYLYLPLRAHFEPFNNLGDPSTWPNFLWVVLRQGYSQSNLTGDWGIAADQARLWAWHTLNFGAFWVAPLGILGIVWLWKHRRAEARMLGLLYAMTFVSVVLLNRTLPDVRWLADIFILPAQALLALGAAVGWGVVSLYLGSRRSGLAIALVLGLGAASACLHYRGLDRSSDFTAYDYGSNVLDSLPHGAVYAADGDYHYMPLLYQQCVMGRRPDVEILIASMMGQASYQDRLFRRRGVRAQGTNAQDAILSLLSQAPVYLSLYHPSIDASALAPYKLWEHGLVDRVGKEGPADIQDDAAWAIRLDPRSEFEPLERLLWPWYAVALVNAGNELAGAGQVGQAVAAYRLSLEMPGEKPESEILFNLGSALEQGGHELMALDTYQHSVALDPTLTASRDRIQAITVAIQPWKEALKRADQEAKQGDGAKALPIYEAALTHGMESPGLWRNIGIVKFQKGDFRGADLAFQKSIALLPSDPLLYEYRVMALEKMGATPGQLRGVLTQGLQESGDSSLKTLLGKLSS